MIRILDKQEEKILLNISYLLTRDPQLLEKPEQLSFALCIAEIEYQIIHQQKNILTPYCISTECLVMNHYVFKNTMNQLKKAQLEKKLQQFSFTADEYQALIDNAGRDSLYEGYLISCVKTPKEFQEQYRDTTEAFMFHSNSYIYLSRKEFIEKYKKEKAKSYLFIQKASENNLSKLTISQINFYIDKKIKMNTQLYQTLIDYTKKAQSLDSSDNKVVTYNSSTEEYEIESEDSYLL